jgi:hypothetical protein
MTPALDSTDCRMGLMLSTRFRGLVLLASLFLNPACYAQDPSAPQPYFEIWSPASKFFAPTTPMRNALYRNNHDGTFIDVTEKAGVAGRDFGIGRSRGGL